MSPELSLRLLEVIPVLQQTLELEELWKVQDEFAEAKVFEDLSKETQLKVRRIEYRLGISEKMPEEDLKVLVEYFRLLALIKSETTRNG